MNTGSSKWFVIQALIVLLVVIVLSPLSGRASDRFTIHSYFSPGAGAVNTYWIETADEIIVIDGQRTLSEAEAALVPIKATRKPITAIFLTHPHPDHFTGIRAFADYAPDAPIYGSRLTREAIDTDANSFVSLSREMLGDDFPDEVAVPTVFVEDGDVLELAGIEFRVRQLSPNEASVMTLLHIPEMQVLFSADVVNNSRTPFLLEKHTGAWVEQLETLAELFPDVETIYPGHGEPGSKSVLIRNQLEYLTLFRKLVSDRLTNDGQITSNEKEQIIERMNIWYADHLPVAAIPALLEKNIDAVADELSN